MEEADKDMSSPRLLTAFIDIESQQLSENKTCMM